MHVDGKSTLASVSKWNSGRINFMFSKLSKKSIGKERKRYDKAMEDMQRAQKWAKKTKND